ncbi:hypothetical protein MBANPS3_011976 [Mucor bainieri]
MPFYSHIKAGDSVMERYIRDKWERRCFAASQEDLVLLPTPSLSSASSSLVSSPMPQQQQQQHVLIAEPSNYNPFLGAADHFQVTQTQAPQQHHKHVIRTTPFAGALTTNPFLQQQPQQLSMAFATTNPFLQHPFQ